MTLFSFRGGFVQSRTLGRVLAQVDSVVALGGTITNLLKWNGGKWSTYKVDWPASRIWAKGGDVFAMGPQGFVLHSSSAGQATETIDPTGQGSERSGDFLDLRQIGERMYACGMSRQVYRRDGDNQWTRVDQGTVQPAGSFEIAGFTSMDGLDESDFYAVGYAGEVWRCLRGSWNQMDSVTNVILHCVRVVGPDRIYARGQNGVLLRGSANRWAVLDTSAVEEQGLWSIQIFNDEVYLASEKSLYKLDKNDVAKKVTTGLAKDCTYRHLHANDGVMWSFGGKNIAWTDDGKKWTDVTP